MTTKFQRSCRFTSSLLKHLPLEYIHNIPHGLLLRYTLMGISMSMQNRTYYTVVTSTHSLTEAPVSRMSWTVQWKPPRVSVASLDHTSDHLVMGLLLFSFWR